MRAPFLHTDDFAENLMADSRRNKCVITAQGNTNTVTEI